MSVGGVSNLEPYAIIGFDGSALKGLKAHPNGEHIVYPMGNKVCIQEWRTKKMNFLSGHSNSVSTVAVSPKGSFIGSGQINHIGFKASVRLWDFKKKIQLGTHELHKVRVEAIAFSSDERYMISIGGRDDGQVVLWDTVINSATGTAAATKLTAGDAMTVCALNCRPNSFVTGGDGNLRVWNIRHDNKNLDVVDVSLGKLRRCIRCVCMSEDDTYGYAGTSTGDLIKFSVKYDACPAAPVDGIKPAIIGCLAKCGPLRKGNRPAAVCYSQGDPIKFSVKYDACPAAPVDVIKPATIGCLAKCDPLRKGNRPAAVCYSQGDPIKFSVKYDACPAAPVDVIKPATIGCLAKCDPLRKGNRPAAVCYSQGVESVIVMSDGCLIVGAGDGTIDMLDEINWRGDFPKGKLLDPTRPHFRALKTAKVRGSITSLELLEAWHGRGTARLLLVGTRTSEIYALALDAAFQPVLLVTCHRCAINDVAFPKGMSGVFATAGAGDVRVWNLETGQELLRINVPNFTCSAVLFSADGKSIVSAWNDGCIRAFTPLTGRLMFCILNTHNKGTSALDMTRDGKTLISGGCEGQVRVWDIQPQKQSLRKVLKEHKSPVSAIQVSPNDMEAVSAGTDGSCIIWDLLSLSRRQVLYANTLFMCVCFEPTGCQLLTGGTDRRVAYWEAGSGNLARELEASKAGAVNGIHISHDGNLFVTGANDQIVKLWKYQEGIYSHVGLGHAGAVTAVRFSPDAKYIVSCCAAGSVFVWKTPAQYLDASKPAPSPKETKAESKIPPAKSLKEELKLPLKEVMGDQGKSSGDRRHKLPAAPSKDEKIDKIDTGRSTVHSSCPCQPNSKRSASTGRSVDCKGNKDDNLPTRTTSKEFINRNQMGGGDKKK